MKTSKLQFVCASIAIFLVAGTLLGPAAPKPAIPDWQTTFHQRLSIYGHRNRIIVSDAAFPAYSQIGIETIVVDDSLPTVLKYVAQAIASSKHVRATVFLDQEFQFVQEADYPGVTQLRQEITNTLGKSKPTSISHSEVLSRIDEAGKTFRILFIKTNTTIPYTSVYMRLDCGYMTEEVENKIRNGVAAANK